MTERVEYTEIADLLLAARHLAGLSQLEVAERIAMRQGSYSKIERRGNPSVGIVQRVAAALGASLDLSLVLHRQRLVLVPLDGAAPRPVDDPRVPRTLSERQIGEVLRALRERDGRGSSATVTLKRSTFTAVLDRLDAYSQITFALGPCEHCGKETPIGLCPPIKDD